MRREGFSDGIGLAGAGLVRPKNPGVSGYVIRLRVGSGPGLGGLGCEYKWVLGSGCVGSVRTGRIF